MLKVYRLVMRTGGYVMLPNRALEILWVQAHARDLLPVFDAHPWLRAAEEVTEDWQLTQNDADYILPAGTAALHLFLSTYDHS